MSKENTHYLLVKSAGHSKDGIPLNALESAKAILKFGCWPLFERTPCKTMIQPGHSVAIYLSGAGKYAQHVIARAVVKNKVLWSARMSANYPLVMEGLPSIGLELGDIHLIENPINVSYHLDELELIPKKNRLKWGVALIGGVKSVSLHDYNILTKLGA